MRKILMLLLVIGILACTCAVVEEICQEDSVGEHIDFTNDEPTGDGLGDPAPCGGGEGGGAGGGQPG